MKKNHSKKSRKSKSGCNKKTNLPVLLRILALFIPPSLYMICTSFLFTTPNSGLIIMGLFGAVFIGIGLVSIVGFLDKSYFGHFFTSAFLVIGAIIIGVSSLIMYSPIYLLLDERYVTYYFILWIFLVALSISYVMFRGEVNKYFRSIGIGKNMINKSMKGMRNYWWYENLHRTYDLNILFYLNKIFTIVFLCTVLIHLFIGWLTFISIIMSVLFCLECVIIIVMYIFLSITKKRQHSERATDYTYVYIGIILPLVMCVCLIRYLSLYLV